MPHLFEFMDQEWVPLGLRGAMRDSLECVSSSPFRSYDRWVANVVLDAATQEHYHTVVELVAGTAPGTRLMATESNSGNVQVVGCELNPDVGVYQELERKYPGVVKPCYGPVDISKHHEWPPRTLLFLSATLHHIPPEVRPSVLIALANSAERVIIFE